MGKRKKKKSRFGYYLYAVVVLILIITNITLGTLLLFHVQKIKISGNTYSESREILEWVKEDPYTSNSLYALAKFKIGAYKKPVYLESVKVGLGAPWTLNIKVKEKKMAGCIQDGKQYIYFDEDGLVLLKGRTKIEGIPVVEGLKTKDEKQYKKLSIHKEKEFLCMVNMLQSVKKSKMKPDRIVWEKGSVNLYFQDVCVQFGKARFDEKLRQIPPILEELEGKKGILHLEHYNETSTNISFEQKK